MSRGLGLRQRDVLVELLLMEREGDCSSRGLVGVSRLLNRLWERRWRAPYQQREEAREIARAEQRAHDRARTARMDALERSLRRWRRRKDGTPRLRAFPSWAEAEINPSRVLRLLEQRGLVDRSYLKNRGPGSRLALTDAGRSAARLVLDEVER